MRKPIYVWTFVGVVAAAYALSLTYGDSAATRAAPSQEVERFAPVVPTVLFENEIEVGIGGGEKEPAHTHRDPSVMIVYQDPH